MIYIKKIEAVILYILLGLLIFAICQGTLELAYRLFNASINPPYFRINPQTLFEGFGLLLNVVIGLELVKVLKLHLTQSELRPELVIEVAIVAMCNKVITLDIKHLSGETLFGLAALLLALSAGYFILNKIRREDFKKIIE
jgi:uncharacterized membrane protein (DUF373 family)